MEKLISVIMSTYNETIEELKSSIESILNQTYKNIEFIIVDDNPQNEDIKNYLDSIVDRRVTVIYNEKNLGLVDSLNKALLHCNGFYIARMDADDISCKTRFQEQMDYLEKGNYDLIGSNIELIDENGRHIKNKQVPSDTNILYHKLMRKNILAHPTWFGKKSLFIDLNGYRHIPRCEDYDFILRAINKDCKIGCVNSILLKYRIRTNSITQSGYSEQYVLSKFLSNLARKNCMEIENIEKYIDSSEYLNDISDYKKFKCAKDNIKKGYLRFNDIVCFFSSRYLKELIKDKFC